MSDSERALLERARRGDHEAFGEVVLRYQASLRGYAARFIVSPEDVFDVVQDVFVDAFAALDRFEVDRPFGPWIRTICRNRVYRFLRDRKSRVSSVVVQLDAIMLDAKPQSDESDEHLSALRRCMDDLPTRNRSLVRLRYARGMSIDEIALQVERTPASVAMALSRLRGSLRSCIEQRLLRDRDARIEGGLT